MDRTELLYHFVEKSTVHPGEERPELQWLKERYQAFMHRHNIAKKESADRYLYENMYKTIPADTKDLLKIRYWRTGRHFPVRFEVCTAFGRALGLSERELQYLLQGYYDSCDRFYTGKSVKDSVYQQRTTLMQKLVDTYLTHIPHTRLEQLHIRPDALRHNIRHLYYTDALEYVSVQHTTQRAHRAKHIASVNYDSEFCRNLKLLGVIPRKTMIRHLIILGGDQVSPEWLSSCLHELGYLPLQDSHTLKTGEHLDRLLLQILEEYQTFQMENNRTCEEKKQWLRQNLSLLDHILVQTGQKNLRFMYFKTLREWTE
ncbi:MAG: hypothetical protein K2I96_01815 [Lachnospiraceae bacterium]|nr:hypothetical protein [Lachnospiraceae bacterium]